MSWVVARWSADSLFVLRSNWTANLIKQLVNWALCARDSQNYKVAQFCQMYSRSTAFPQKSLQKTNRDVYVLVFIFGGKLFLNYFSKHWFRGPSPRICPLKALKLVIVKRKQRHKKSEKWQPFVSAIFVIESVPFLLIFFWQKKHSCSNKT